MQTQSSIVQHKRIGELLGDAEILTSEQLPVGLKEAERRSLRLGEVLVALRYLSSDDLENVLQAQTRLNEGTLRLQQVIAALKYAAAHRTGFEQGLAHVRQEGRQTSGCRRVARHARAGVSSVAQCLRSRNPAQASTGDSPRNSGGG